MYESTKGAWVCLAPSVLCSKAPRLHSAALQPSVTRLWEPRPKPQVSVSASWFPALFALASLSCSFGGATDGPRCAVALGAAAEPAPAPALAPAPAPAPVLTAPLLPAPVRAALTSTPSTPSSLVQSGCWDQPHSVVRLGLTRARTGSHGLKTHHQLLHNADGLNDVVVEDSEPAKGGTLAEGKHSWGLWHQIATLPRESHVGERLLV